MNQLSYPKKFNCKNLSKIYSVFIIVNFNFSEEVKSLGANGVYFVINGMKNKKNDIEFDKIKDSFLQQVDINSINDKIANSDILRGFRELREAVNCSGKILLHRCIK